MLQNLNGNRGGISDNGKRLGFRRAKKAETEYKHKTKLNNKQYYL